MRRRLRGGHDYLSPMPRYAAFLRGVSPTNARMPELKQAFESAGFREVRTVLSSGNVVFDTRSAPAASIQRAAEAAMKQRLGQSFLTIVRSLDALHEVLASDPYRGFRVAPAAKRIVTFFRQEPRAGVTLPVELDGARLLAIQGGELFSAYLPTPRGPVFMSLIEKTFGKEVTTRTWDTVAKVARA
jgi:uncharacterized protein (DUF1697 family)